MSTKNSRTTMRIAFITVLAVMLAGTFAAAQEYSCDYSKADFSQFKTYAWASGHPVEDKLANDSIVSSIDAQLSAKGLTRVSPSENPDVLVSYSVVFDRDVRPTGFKDGLRNLRWSPSSRKFVTLGMLVVNIVDADDGAMLWRGMVTGDVDANASPEKRDKKTSDVVQEMFRNYPPEK